MLNSPQSSSRDLSFPGNPAIFLSFHKTISYVAGEIYKFYTPAVIKSCGITPKRETPIVINLDYDLYLKMRKGWPL